MDKAQESLRGGSPVWTTQTLIDAISQYSLIFTSNKTLYVAMVMCWSFNISRSPNNENRLCGARESCFLLQDRTFFTKKVDVFLVQDWLF